MVSMASVVHWSEICLHGTSGSLVCVRSCGISGSVDRMVQWSSWLQRFTGRSSSMVSVLPWCSVAAAIHWLQWHKWFYGLLLQWSVAVAIHWFCGSMVSRSFRRPIGSCGQTVVRCSGSSVQCVVQWLHGSMDLPTPSNFVMLGMAQGNAPASSAAPISCKMVKWTQPLLGAASPPNSSSAVEPPTPWIKCSGTELHTNFRRPREVRRNGRPTTHGVVHGCALVCWRLMVQ